MIALKIIMVFIGLIIFAIISVFIMAYTTIMAIKREYDWSKVVAAATTATKKVQEKVQEKIQEKKQEKENK